MSRQFILGLFLPCAFGRIPVDKRRWNHLIIHALLCFRFRRHLIFLNFPSASIGRRPPLLHALVNRIQRRPGAQIPARLPRTHLDRHPPRHVLRKGDSDRVWSIPGAVKLYQFRRGTPDVRIWSKNFNLAGS